MHIFTYVGMVTSYSMLHACSAEVVVHAYFGIACMQCLSGGCMHAAEVVVHACNAEVGTMHTHVPVYGYI